MDWIVNAFGILGILTTIVIYQQKDNHKLLFWKITTDLIWIVHYTANGNYSVVAITLVAVLRSIVLLNDAHAWARHKSWLWVFIGCSLLFSALAWKDWTSLLTTVSSLLCIAAYWFRVPRINRILSIPAAILFLLNVWLNFSFWGFICESFLLLSAIVGFFRLDWPYYREKIAQRSQEP